MIRKRIFSAMLLSAIVLSFPGQYTLAYVQTIVENGGEVSGIVTLKEKPKEIPPQSVLLNSDYCGEMANDESFILNPQSGGLANVVVSVEGIEKGKNRPPETLIIENAKCRFPNHVQAGATGDWYEIINSDPILHNAHLKMGEMTLINIILNPSAGIVVKNKIHKSGLISIRCDKHKFMTSFIKVFDHPYFSVTDNKGHFNIKEIPSGNYTLHFWHEKMGEIQKTLVIKEGQKQTSNLTW